MFEIIFILIVIYIIMKKFNEGSSSLALSKLYTALQKNEFTNRKVLVSNSQFTLIVADTHGENYLFAVKKGTIQYIKPDIISIYETATKAHIHNIVLINSLNKPLSIDTRKAIGEYGMEVWDMNKLNSMVATSNLNYNSNSINELNSQTSPVTKSVLRTSNTSDDHCKIDTNSYDPIQENAKRTSIFGKLFEKPEKL